MLELHFGAAGSGAYTVMCLGAHCDDLEIGCSGTLMKLSNTGMPLSVIWVVFSADDEREREARCSAEVVLGKVTHKEITVKRFPDGFFPSVQGGIKEYFETLKQHVCPDIVFTHFRGDLHQDHRVIGELTWNTFRDHLILEYEIPKYDGDLGSPNVFVRLDEAVCQAKVDNLLASFRGQQGKRWFTRDLFLSLMRLRGMEANSPSNYAEAFYSRKLVVA
jgi:LmbE family N-acetylglucosaminyl deacetylase